jgi:hypothetical protein
MMIGAGMFVIGMFGIIGADVGGGGGTGPAAPPKRPRLRAEPRSVDASAALAMAVSSFERCPHAIQAANTPKNKPLSRLGYVKTFREIVIA